MTQPKTYTILWLLFASLALMETGYGIVYPVFARSLEAIGGGVEALGYMTVAFAAGQFLLAPFFGSLADRYGRRPFILLGLASIALSNVLFLLLDSIPLYIVTRFLQGALSAGLLPAAMGVVADLVPEHERGRWGGLVMGGYSAGFILGPAIGGILYDTLGPNSPFIISALAGAIGLFLAWFTIPETLQSPKHPKPKEREPLGSTLPRPLYILFTLLIISFMDTFIFAFSEPQMVFYFYNELNLSTTQFGIVVGVYGIALTLTQTMLGQLSDRFGRTSMIALGFGLNIPFYLGLIFASNFYILLLLALLAGLGIGISSPASNAFYLDITKTHQARIMGLKESAAAAGMIVGPLLVALLTRFLSARGTFTVSLAFTLLTVILAMTILSTYHHKSILTRLQPQQRE